MRMRPIHGLFAALLLLPAMSVSAAGDPAVGQWRAVEGPDLASRLELTADGHFQYFLAYGALDEEAKGRWTRDGATVRLTTEPKPKPSTITLATASPQETKGAPLSLIVLAPDAKPDEGIAGIDFRIEFDRGAPLEGYTQYYGWQAETLDGRVPLWVQLFEPIHGLASARYAIPAGTRSLVFLFQPNDYGVVDFNASAATVEDGRLTLQYRGGQLHYVRAEH